MDSRLRGNDGVFFSGIGVVDGFSSSQEWRMRWILVRAGMTWWFCVGILPKQETPLLSLYRLLSLVIACYRLLSLADLVMALKKARACIQTTHRAHSRATPTTTGCHGILRRRETEM